MDDQRVSRENISWCLKEDNDELETLWLDFREGHVQQRPREDEMVGLERGNCELRAVWLDSSKEDDVWDLNWSKCELRALQVGHNEVLWWRSSEDPSWRLEWEMGDFRTLLKKPCEIVSLAEGKTEQFCTFCLELTGRTTRWLLWDSTEIGGGQLVRVF